MSKIIFPVAGKHTFRNDWGDPRGGGTRTHKGNDIFAAKGTPVVAVVNGVITDVGPSGISGNRIWINHQWFYAHLDHFAKGIEVGRKVKAGQVIGYVGNTGNAAGGAYHLHFGYDPHGTNGLYWVNPFSILTTGSVSAKAPPVKAAARVAARTTDDSGGSRDALPNAPVAPTGPSAVPGGIYRGFDVSPQPEPTARPSSPYQTSDPHDLWGTVIQSPNLSPETRSFWARVNQGREGLA